MTRFSFVFLVFANFLLWSESQLLPEEVPPELKYLMEGDYDTWEAPAEIQRKFPYYLSGFDDENRPIWIVEFGKWDIKSVVERGPEWEKILNKYCNQWLYRVIQSADLRAAEGQRVTEGVTIHDFEGYSLNQLRSVKTIAFSINQIRQLTIAMQFLHIGYVINVNYLAANFLNMAKPFFGSQFYRLEIYGTNRDRWLSELRRNLPEDQLPPRYGGFKNFTAVKVFG